MIDLNISQQSQIYKENLNQLQEENSKDKALLEELLKKKEEFKKMKETKFVSEKKEIEDINAKIMELYKRRMELRNKIFREMKQIWHEKIENDKKIAELQKKLGLPVTINEHDQKPHELKMFPFPFHHKYHHMKFMPMAQLRSPLMKFNTINECPQAERNEKKDIHFFIICDGCGMQPLVGKRYKCKGCEDFDYCEKCYENNKDTHKHEFTLIEKPEMRNPFMPALNLSFGEHPRHHFFHHHRPHFGKEKKEEKNEIIEKSKSKKHENMPKKIEHCPTMGNIFQDNKISDKIIHFGVKCDGCGVLPIVGCRYKCAFCDNFDYCEKCENKLSKEHNHPFLKIYEPEMNPVFFKCYQ
jgi:hypothetical protein